MAIYRRLSLAHGGGIISTAQQAEQVKNEAHIIIGLGGTGVDCIRRIKTQVHTRLKPDDPDAAMPKYEHIRFIGVDSTEKSRGGSLNENEKNNRNRVDSVLALDDTEFFSLYVPNIEKILNDSEAIKEFPELNWLNYEQIDGSRLGNYNIYASGVRQIGRLLMMERSEAFMEKVETEINRAKEGLSTPRVYIHICSGLSGGTGSGCFLDVCYMIRSIARQIGGITTFGYFFLPDVNLSNIPIETTDVRNYIPKLGYAAMQELDYCMSLPHNGGSFTQIYQGGKEIKWDSQPVDFCHLIGAKYEKCLIENSSPYDYALNTTSEFIMSFLAKNYDEFGLQERISNYRWRIRTADEKKKMGACMQYSTIGAISVVVPMCESNTYLAAELFDKFSQIGSNQPTKADVEKLAVKALARTAINVDEIYNYLLREIKSDASDDYALYTDDWKFVRDYGNSHMVDHYTNQTATKLNRIEVNAKSMTSMNNNLSLVGRVRTELEEIIRDLERGPVYAHHMISAAESHNMLNIIDGLIKENSERWDQEAYKSEGRRNEYEKAKMDFELRRKNGLFDNDQKRFEEYEYRLKLLSQHNYAVSVYAKLAEVLKDFRKQLEDVTAGYYIKLSRVMENLLETFRDNRDALKSERIMQKKGSFEMPMMTIEELKPALDIEIEKINVADMLDQFMALLVGNESEWLTEDEHKISKLVTDFFVKTAFNGFSNRGITFFLKDKYQVDNDELIADYLCKDVLVEIRDKVIPLYRFNDDIWTERQVARYSSIMCPGESISARIALNGVSEQFNLRCSFNSTVRDRISVFVSYDGFPMSSYINAQEYEQKYYLYPLPGIHLYEGKDIPGMKFNDWSKLPSIIPQSQMKDEALSGFLKKQVHRARDLFERAIKLGIIDYSGYICTLDEEAIVQLQQLSVEVNDFIASIDVTSELEGLKDSAQDYLVRLKKAVKLPMKATNHRVRDDGNQMSEEDSIRIHLDYFVSAPVYQILVTEIMDKMRDNLKDAMKCIDELKSIMNDYPMKRKAMEEYIEALFTGVFSLKGKVLTYHKTEAGMTTDIILSKLGDEFPYAHIPIYQGFVSYMAFDDDMKANIKRIADERYNVDAPELDIVYMQLEENFSDERMNAYTQLAQHFENSDEIIELLMYAKQIFIAM